MASPFIGVSGQMPARAPRYAITNARIVTVAGPVIDKGTVVMRDGVIEEVGAAVTAPADALVVDGTGLTVYPGLIDMANTAVVESRTSAPVAAGRRRRLAAAAVAPPSRRPMPSPGRIRSVRPAPAISTPTSPRPRWLSTKAMTCAVSPPPASPRPSPSRHRAFCEGRARS